ncbi:MAG: hypothetical protein P8N68_12010 [Paracoccaceae bacterium]|nr:hypothetical protein [Paracoccaceae bacterium]
MTSKTNKTSNDQNNITTRNAPENTAWQDAVQNLIDLRFSLEKARVELAVAQAEANQNPFAPGVATKQHLITALSDNLKGLFMDMWLIHRAAGMPMPSEDQIIAAVRKAHPHG